MTSVLVNFARGKSKNAAAKKLTGKEPSCRNRFALDMPMIGKKTNIGKMNFTKSSDGQWRVVE